MCGPYDNFSEYKTRTEGAFAIHAHGGVIRNNQKTRDDIQPSVMVIHNGRDLSGSRPLIAEGVEIMGTSKMVYSNNRPLYFHGDGYGAATVNCWIETDAPLRVKMKGQWWVVQPKTGLRLNEEALIDIPEVAPMLALRTGKVPKFDPAELA